MRNAGLDEVQAGIKISRRNINNLRYAGDTTLRAYKEGELSPCGHQGSSRRQANLLTG